MYIYLLRHGFTDWNARRLMQGRSDIPLNAIGLQQAKDAAVGMRDIPIDCILSSPLQRARQTAEEMAKIHPLPIQTEDLLVEMGFGEMEGAERDLYPECEVIFSDPEHYVPLTGGESYDELMTRAYRLLNDSLSPLEGKYQHVLCCTHGALIRSVVVLLKGYERKDFWCDPPQPNCSCSILHLEKGKFTLIEEGHSYIK